MVLHLGVLGLNHRNIYKKILENRLLQSHLAYMPEIQYVALPVQMEVPGSKMAPRCGGLGLNHRNT